MSKERRTFSLDPENDRFCESHDNASALVDDLLTQFRESGERQTAALDLQIKHKREEFEEKEREAKRVKGELEDLQRLRAEFEKQEDAEIQSAREALEGVPRDPTNPAVENWAGKLGMTPQELIDEIDSNE